jgi:hypothetical protein
LPTTSATPRGDLNLASLGWYEVLDVSDTSGNSERTLVFGSLAGTLTGQVALGSRRPGDIAGGVEPYAWQGPQATGIYGDGQVVVWGRDGVLGRIEILDVATGDMTTLIEVNDAVQVAAADEELEAIFFITVDEASRAPTGIWKVPADGGAPSRIDYRVGRAPVDGAHHYRLGVSDDASLLVVQAGDETATVIDTMTGATVQLEPGGPFLAFAGDELVAMTARDPDGRGDVASFDTTSGNGRVVARSVDAATVLATSDGPTLAILRSSPGEVRAFEVSIVSSNGGERVVYVQDPTRIGQLLAQPDRYAIGAELPPGWILLGTSFLPWIEAPGWAPKNGEDTDPPLMVDIETGELVRLGPFR